MIHPVRLGFNLYRKAAGKRSQVFFEPPPEERRNSRAEPKPLTLLFSHRNTWPDGNGCRLHMTLNPTASGDRYSDREREGKAGRNLADRSQ